MKKSSKKGKRSNLREKKERASQDQERRGIRTVTRRSKGGVTRCSEIDRCVKRLRDFYYGKRQDVKQTKTKPKSRTVTDSPPIIYTTIIFLAFVHSLDSDFRCLLYCQIHVPTTTLSHEAR